MELEATSGTIGRGREILVTAASEGILLRRDLSLFKLQPLTDQE